MSRRRHKPEDAVGRGPDAWSEEACPVAPLVIIGAGRQLAAVQDLLAEYPEYHAVAILDPHPDLRGKQVRGLRVCGWLADWPEGVQAAVLSTPYKKTGFDRESVFRFLMRRHILLPLLRSARSVCAADVVLRRGSVLLPGCRIEKGAVLGENLLVGSESVVQACAEIPDHQVVADGTTYPPLEQAGTRPVKPSRMEATLTRTSEPIQEVIRIMNASNMEIVLVLDGEGRLAGTVTDGDIRRAILSGIQLNEPVSLIMNADPVSVDVGTSYSAMLDIMRRRSIRHLPVLDGEHRPVRLERLERIVDDLRGKDAIVMAGGLGTRLRPLTETVPKPLLPVKGKPILDHILDGLRRSGIRDVAISVNYLGEQIRQHVGDGGEQDLHVNYLEEQKRLGTAGALTLLQPRPRQPFIVMNGDLLTNLNFTHLLRFQRENGYPLVMCVKRHQVRVPYGVVDLDGDRIRGLREKPVYRHFINAGIYVLDPACLDWIPRDEFYDMTDLINGLLARGESVGAFPIYEYWRDIGKPEDLAAVSNEPIEWVQTPAEGNTVPCQT